MAHGLQRRPLPNVNGEAEARSELGGKKSFGNESYGYGSTRYDLSSLAGQSVRFRFRAVSDGQTAYWWVDNLSVYTC
jgi:bacillolysin